MAGVSQVCADFRKFLRNQTGDINIAAQPLTTRRCERERGDGESERESGDKASKGWKGRTIMSIKYK